MALSGLYTFVAGQTILASEVNAEFNQLINFLNGTVLADATMKNSAAGTPTLTLDHTGGGKPLSVKVGGNAAVEVNNLRQLVLTPVAGNQPIVLSVGAVKVNYLDADKFDGLEAVAFLRADTQLAWASAGGATGLGVFVAGEPTGFVLAALVAESVALQLLASSAVEPASR